MGTSKDRERSAERKAEAVLGERQAEALARARATAERELRARNDK